MDLPRGWENFTDGDIFREVYFLCIALLLAFGTLQFSGTVLQTDKPVVSVVSCSMYPEPQEQGLYKGDILVVKGTSFEDIKEGDTIVYDVPDHIEFTVSGQSYTLEKTEDNRRPSVSTPAGTVTLIEAVRSSSTERALLSINGERVTVTEGESISAGNLYVNINEINAMPIPVVHRVVRKHQTFLETKGINNPGQLEFEKHVEPSQIHGKVFFNIPRVGLVKIIAMDLIGFSGDKPLVLDQYRPCTVQA